MAVKGSTDDQGQPQAPAPGVIDAPQMSAPGPQAQGSPFNGNAFSVLNMFSAGASLGGATEEYLKTLKSYFAGDTSGSLVKIDVRRLTEPNGAHAFVSDKCAIVLLFTEALTNLDTQNFIPTSANIGYASRALKAHYGNDMRLLNAIVVPPTDYVRAQQMAWYISLTLAIATNPRLHDMNVSAIANNQYSMDPDVNNVRSFINNLNPSSVQPRVNIGFVLYAKAPRQQGLPQIGPMEEMKAIAAVGAYTEIQRTVVQGGLVRYQPIVHITSIVSGMPVPGIIPLCLAIAADQFTGPNGRWLQQFTSFRKGEPNLGQLFPDPSDPKKQWFTSDLDQVGNLRSQYFNDAILAIDVVEGQARIPDLVAYADVQKASAVFDQAQNFFGAKLQLDRNQAPYIIMATEYIGVYGDATGTLVDSRNMDYMTLLVNGAQDALTQNALLHYPQDPAGRSRILFEKTGGNYKSLFTDVISIPSPAFLGTLARAVQGSLGIEPPQGQNRMVATDWMQHHADQYRQQNFSVSKFNTNFGYTSGNLYNV